MRPYAFQNFSSRLPITEPMHVVREVEDNQREVNNETARRKSGGNAPLSPAPRSEEELVASIRSLSNKGKEACFHALHDLEAATFDKRSSVRAAAIDMLGILEEKAPIDILLEALTDTDWDVRAAAAQGLGRAGGNVPVDTLIVILLHEEHESVQEALISTLGLQKERTPLDILANFLQDGENWLIRVAAAWALGRQGNRAPTRPLICALTDRNMLVREAAARVLGTLKTRDYEIKKALLRASHDEEEAVQEAVAWALEQFSDSSIEDLSPHESFPTTFDKVQGWIGLRLQDPLFHNAAMANWQQIQRNKTFTALTEFIRDRKGYLEQSTLFDSPEGQTLLIICDYQHAKKSILQVLQDLTIIKIIRTLSTEFDEVVQYAFTQAIANGEKHPWDELLVVSFTLSTVSNNLPQDCQLRVVISGMGYPRIGHYQESILDQIVTTWSKSINEPLVCQHPHDLVDLKIWYQPPEENWVLQLA